MMPVHVTYMCPSIVGKMKLRFDINFEVQH